MTLTDLLVASTPIILLIVCLAWRGIPTLIEWRRERKYQAEWHRTFGAASRRTSKRSPPRAGRRRVGNADALVGTPTTPGRSRGATHAAERLREELDR